MQFNDGAKFIIERNMGRQIDKDEAREILKIASDAGLVHVADNNKRSIFFATAAHAIAWYSSRLWHSQNQG